ncbi:hypothetical protein LCGC14_0195470 [marine sediment metagenome]|uniref:Uncharacterized protein n=1 Tax=marine sediment metagenome TaxID=412755 RepID=A0A0F9UPZ4_9ZZZZ
MAIESIYRLKFEISNEYYSSRLRAINRLTKLGYIMKEQITDFVSDWKHTENNSEICTLSREVLNPKYK